MSTLALDTSPTAICKPAADALALRITGGGLDGRVVRLSSGKCTIGAGPQCTLRLLGAGIRPLHCLIVRGAKGTYVRRWAPDTLLNGRSFEDALLEPGDRLTVGPVGLEVLEQARGFPQTVPAASLEARTVPPAVPTAPVRESVEQSSQIPAALTDDEIAQLTEDVRSQIANLRGRARKLVDALRKSRKQQEELESRVEASLLAQREAESRLAEMNASARAADERSDKLQAKVDRLQHEVTELTAKLDSQRVRQRVLSEQLDAAHSREAALKLGDPPPEAAESGRTEHSIGNATEPRGNDAPTVQAQVVATERSAAPVSFIEQFAPHLLDDEAEGQETTAPDRQERSEAYPSMTASADYNGDNSDTANAVDELVSPNVATEAIPAAAPQPNDEDESLEDYMAKLMQRVRGSEQPHTAPPRASRPERRSPVETQPAVAETVVLKPEQHQAEFRLEDIRRTTALPERGGNFAAMRELANQSAHRAISKHRVTKGTRDAIGRMFASAVCLASGGLILWFAPELRSAASAGGVVAIVASAYFAVRGLSAFLEVIRDNGDNNSSTDEGPRHG